MPSNIILINRYDELSWIISDSKMEKLIKYLEDNGEKYTEDEIISDVSSCSCLQT